MSSFKPGANMSSFKPGANLTESLSKLADYENSLHKISDAGRVSVTFDPVGLQFRKDYELGNSVIGHIGKYSNITDNSGRPKGHIDGFGNIIDSSGRVKGSMDEFRNVKDTSGRVTGFIDNHGNIRKS